MTAWMSFVLVERNEMRCENLFSMTRRTFFSCLVSLSGRLEAAWLIPTLTVNISSEWNRIIECNQNLANVRKETRCLENHHWPKKDNKLENDHSKFNHHYYLKISMHHCTQTKSRLSTVEWKQQRPFQMSLVTQVLLSIRWQSCRRLIHTRL